jgi:hypothetical protein
MKKRTVPYDEMKKFYKSAVKKISPEDSGEKYVDGLVSTGK